MLQIRCLGHQHVKRSISFVKCPNDLHILGNRFGNFIFTKDWRCSCQLYSSLDELTVICVRSLLWPMHFLIMLKEEKNIQFAIVRITQPSIIAQCPFHVPCSMFHVPSYHVILSAQIRTAARLRSSSKFLIICSVLRSPHSLGWNGWQKKLSHATYKLAFHRAMRQYRGKNVFYNKHKYLPIIM